MSSVPLLRPPWLPAERPRQQDDKAPVLEQPRLGVLWGSGGPTFHLNDNKNRRKRAKYSAFLYEPPCPYNTDTAVARAPAPPPLGARTLGKGRRPAGRPRTERGSLHGRRRRSKHALSLSSRFCGPKCSTSVIMNLETSDRESQLFRASFKGTKAPRMHTADQRAALPPPHARPCGPCHLPQAALLPSLLSQTAGPPQLWPPCRRIPGLAVTRAGPL